MRATVLAVPARFVYPNEGFVTFDVNQLSRVIVVAVEVFDTRRRDRGSGEGLQYMAPTVCLARPGRVLNLRPRPR